MEHPTGAAKRTAATASLWTGWPLILAGLGVGWLVGLSFSPIAQVVVASLVGAAAAIASVLMGLGDQSKLPHSRTLAPIVWLVLGTATGATVGVLTRSHGWLAPSGLTPSERASGFQGGVATPDILANDPYAAMAPEMRTRADSLRWSENFEAAARSFDSLARAYRPRKSP
jgi:hypothetical protein